MRRALNKGPVWNLAVSVAGRPAGRGQNQLSQLSGRALADGAEEMSSHTGP